MNTDRLWPVAVAGGGPVGLCTALALARAGVRTLVLEQHESPAAELRASTFHPPTLEMLDTLGLAGTVIAGGLRVDEWQFRIHESHERAVFRMRVLERDTRYPFRVQFPQAEFTAAALARCDAEPLVNFSAGHRVFGLSQDDNGVVVHAEGPQGPYEFRCEYLVGADGAASTVRECLGLAFTGETYPETTILAATGFDFAAHLPGLSPVNYVWARHGTFSLLRVRDFWRVSLYPDEGESVEQALSPARVEQKLQRIVARPGRYAVDALRPYRTHQRIVDSYVHGRVLLAGDAAHVNSPSGGMGMNAGIHDAFSLAAHLAPVARGAAAAATLAGYDAQRRPLARDQVIKRAHQNRARMQRRDPAWQQRELGRLRQIAADPDAAREFLLESSMIAGLRAAGQAY